MSVSSSLSSFSFRGLGALTWLEIKIFVREPLGVIGSVFVPVFVFLVIGRTFGSRMTGAAEGQRGLVGVDLAVFAALLISISAVLSLVTIVAIYRESGILKRLRATPLRPLTILTAHVLVKLLFTAVTVTLMTFLGKRYLPVDIPIPWVTFTLATLISTLSILSLGFVLASLAPTARFAQPIGTIVLYPMIGISGLFMPVDQMSPALRLVAEVTPASHAVSLMRGAWYGHSWLQHVGDLAALAIIFTICTAIAVRVFRWE
jgi:ABC-2 type transport system permease protein